MHRKSTRMARDVWWFFLFVLIAQSAVATYQIFRNAREEARISHSLQVLNGLNRLMLLCADMETSVRGYVISNDKSMLKQYESAQADLPSVLNRLSELTIDNPTYGPQLAKFNELLDQRGALLRQQIGERVKPDIDSAAVNRLISAGRIVQDQIRDRIEDLRAHERLILEDRRASAKSSLSVSLFTTALSALVTIGLLILSRWLMNREIETKRRGDIALRASQERFGALAETMPLMVWIARSDGEIEFFNHHWFEYTGFHEVTDKLSLLPAVHPDHRDLVQQQWQTTVIQKHSMEMECPLRRHDGAYHWHLVRAQAVRNDVVGTMQWFGACIDIDDQRRARNQLEETVRERTGELQQVVEGLNAEIRAREQLTQQLEVTAAELQRSNRELEQFAYVASHDLQEPLRKIQTFSDRLKTRFGDSVEGQLKDYVDRMQSAAGRMRQLINDLLAYSRVSTRPHPMVAVDLNKIAAEVLDDLDDAITKTAAKVDVAPLPTITADALQMRQLFQNIISNALKFRKADVVPHVTITGRIDEESSLNGAGPPAMAKLTFSDNGIGFDPSYSQRIFQVFQRLHGRHEYEGTGIGLAVVRRIVERHGGTITAYGRPDAGATFEVQLPVNQLPLDADLSPAGPSQETIMP